MELTEAELRFALELSPNPLTGIADNEQYWRLGLVEIAKTHPTFRVGFGAQLVAESRFDTEAFDVPGRTGIVVLFKPSASGRDLVVGWVPADRDAEARLWVATLNREIKRVVDADDTHEKGVRDEAAADFDRTKHNKPSDLVAAPTLVPGTSK